LTRKEGKAVTRARLLEAALAILDDEGEGALTTIEVTRRAGIAQSSFYVHFADMDDLLRALVDELVRDRRRSTRAARSASRAAPRDVEALRATFRVPMQHSIAHPRFFRLLVKSRNDRSPLGAWSRSEAEDSRCALVEDLVAAGFPNRTAEDQRRAAMVADVIIAMTERLTLGHLEGRYPDLEEAINVLLAFSRGYFPLLTERPRRKG
jgi:TetR/AcrR family transcriptional regulator, fatty acid biosynthesis regulator